MSFKETYDTAPDVKKRVYTMVGFTALGGLLFGLDQGFVNGALDLIRDEFSLTPSQAGQFTGVLSIGAIIGSLLAGFFSRLLGRKSTVFIASLIFSLCAILSIETYSYEVLYWARFGLGLGVGLAAFIIPLYLSEISPTHIRGGATTMYQLMITIGILLIATTNYLIGNHYHSWRLMMLIVLIPAIIMFIGSFILPRSPRWLVLKNKNKEAKDILTRIRATEKEAKHDYDEMVANINEEREEKLSFFQSITSPIFVKVVLLGLALQMFQQLSGINAMIYYSGDIFKGVGLENPFYGTFFLLLFNMISTILAVKYVDKIGRRTLLLFGAILMAVTLTYAGFVFRSQENGAVLSDMQQITLVVDLLIYIFAFAIAWGGTVWVVCAEIIPLKYRDAGIALTTLSNYFFNWVVASFTPVILASTYGTSNLFFSFAICCLIAWVVVKLFCPETKGTSLEKIEHNLKMGNKLRNIGA